MANALHGKATIELTNVKTGKTERHVEHNMVTNAITDLFAKNPYGCFERATMPAKFMSGICLYKKQITAEADNIFLPGFPDAYAGTNSAQSSGVFRGVMNTTETSYGETGAHLVWDWDTSKGNGTYSAIALTTPCVCNGALFGEICETEEAHGNTALVTQLPLCGTSTHGKSTSESSAYDNYSTLEKRTRMLPSFIDVDTGYQYGIDFDVDDAKVLHIGRCKRPVYSRYISQSNYVDQTMTFDYQETTVSCGNALYEYQTAYTDGKSSNYLRKTTSLHVQDGYMYLITIPINDDNAGHTLVLYFNKIKMNSLFSGSVDVDSWSKSYSNMKVKTEQWYFTNNNVYNQKTCTIRANAFPFSYPYFYVHNGNKVYALNINDETDIKEMSLYGTTSLSNFSLPFQKTAATKFGSFIIVNGQYILDTKNNMVRPYSYYMRGSSTSLSNNAITSDEMYVLTPNAAGSNPIVYCGLNPFLMMTINNVSTFTKTSEQTMKITYDLTIK